MISPYVLRSLAVAVVVLLTTGVTVGAFMRAGSERDVALRSPARPLPPTTRPTPTSAVVAHDAPPPAAVAPYRRPSAPVPLDGCPPPPRQPRLTGPPSWRPAVLVPEASLPAPGPPPTWSASVAPAMGKGMWLWKFKQSDGGDPLAIVRRAQESGLEQLWVRVGDSRDGFYAADVLASLVPLAQARGMAVIGWGFPYLYDPVADAAWGRAALEWRGPGGERLDAFSPDIEASTEGVLLTERRAAVYLHGLREAAGDRALIATVYRPLDRLWRGSYPYRTIARYVDAFAPMIYWGCTEPGAATVEALARLKALRPVHAIGQAYNMGDEGGRPVAPSGAEAWRFLDVAEAHGAVGASFWVWQSMNPEHWTALGAFPWRR